MPLREVPAVKTGPTFPHSPLAPDLQKKKNKSQIKFTPWFIILYMKHGKPAFPIYLPILFKSKSNFLPPPLCSTASSSCGHRHPSGSRASRTSITTSDASRTWNRCVHVTVKSCNFPRQDLTWQWVALPCLIRHKGTVLSSCLRQPFSLIYFHCHPMKTRVNKLQVSGERIKRWIHIL